MNKQMKYSSHNLKLSSGEYTIPGADLLCDTQHYKAVLRTLNMRFSEKERSKIRIADLGCLEGGYSVEFAKAGYDAVGFEAREENIRKCNFLKEDLKLQNLKFIKDDVKNIEKYGKFDVIICAGLLYHLDYPVSYIKTLGKITNKMLLLHTHYAVENDLLYDKADELPETKQMLDKYNYNLSAIEENEGKKGRWFREYKEGEEKETIEKSVWAAYSNHRSFWVLKKDLLQTIREAGFDLVFEQYDFLKNISTDDYIERYDRSQFVGIKS